MTSIKLSSFYVIYFLISTLVLLTSCKSIEKRTELIHKKAFTIDSHCDSPLVLMSEDFDIGKSHNAKETGTKYDIPRMEAGDLDASFFAAFVGQGNQDSIGLEKAFNQTNQIIDAVYKAINAYPAKAEIAITHEDGYRLEKENKRAIYLGIENGYALADKIENIDYFYKKGIRYITLVHTRNNHIADSSTDTTLFKGLSPFGEQVVKRMNNLGIMIDVSHASDSTFYDVLKLSKTPVIASHSCSRALCDNPRNLSDEMLIALAKNGGVIQMCILSDYVKKMPSYPARDSAHAAFEIKHSNWANYNDEQRRNGIREWHQLDVNYPPILANVTDVIDHIDHMVKIAGIDHVGIGTDFDGGGDVIGCYDVSEMKNITKELVKRGYTEEQIIKIWGGNFMRVFKEVEKFKTSN
ncbi:MAG: membrane dipeptidase [Bacteroidia bacterium]|nr:membrane dipeptidase [Bacteroidia bacterium]